MKRLLITTGIFAPDIGGPASYARTLGERLASSGFEVTVLTYSSVLRHQDDASLPFTVRRVWTKNLWGFRHLLYLWQAIGLARHADAVLSLSAVSGGLPSLWAAKLAKKPLVVRVVGDYAWEMAMQTGTTFLLIDEFQKAPAGGRIGRLRKFQRRICKEAAAVIVPSRYLAALVAGWGIPEDRIHVIANGVEASRVVLAKEEARKRIGISGNIILSAGRLVPWKGFLMLIKLMPQLLQTNQFFRLVIMGDGPDMKMLQTVVRNLGLERKVFLVGRKNASEAALYLAAADVFVLNTAYEGFSHQVVEAMAAGVPVVTTAVGGNREIVTQGEDGLLVRYNDEFNLAEAIKTIQKQPELRERLIAEGRKTAQRFSAERMYQETERLLSEIV